MRGLLDVLALALLLRAAALAETEEDYTEDEELILSLIRKDDSQPDLESAPSAHFLRCTKAAWRVPGQYLVVLRSGTHENQIERTMRALRARAARRGYLTEITRTYSGAVRGFLVKMSSDVLHMALKLPHVDYIEEDSTVFAQGLPWNLERIVQTKQESGKYTPPNDGSKVGLYLMDTSIQTGHREIEGRVMVTDFNSVPEEDGVRVHRQANQCDSHGTHTAGVVSGRDSGVARGISVNSVRVLNCQGKGTVSGVLAGLEYIHATLQVQPLSPVIVLLPFAGGFSRTLNTACREMVRSGAVLIAAAGNYQDDACLYSPASEREVITVGATNAADQPLSAGTTGTNVGRCVDLFAPGDDIISASSDCPTCFTTKSGTSQAAAHVAGIAAVLLNENPNASPAEVLQLLRHHSVKQVMNPDSLPDKHRLSTANMVAALPKSTLSGDALLCRSVWSDRSGDASVDTAVAQCRQGEKMFSCSSYSPDGVRSGERIEMRDGQKYCVAHNGIGGGGVYAIARCCTGNGVECQTSASPQTDIHAACPSPEHQLTGCSSHFESGGVANPMRPLHDNRKACPARAGVTTHASCCHAPSMECRLNEHQASDISERVEVLCEDSWTLTGCNSVSHGSVTHGAYARGNTCVIWPSAESKGVVAIAICCRYRPLVVQQTSMSTKEH
ncbi:proprotein convertase subtilisin/kexin type 9 [Hoplias malabaricus]|uniref:proprotein convertase subtilisin/kexin type 9 n=1 Tax=Hoplias malabaricus TaxID=27720 RepID=UPI0034627CAE